MWIVWELHIDVHTTLNLPFQKLDLLINFAIFPTKKMAISRFWTINLKLGFTLVSLPPLACMVAKPEQHTNADELDNPAFYKS